MRYLCPSSIIGKYKGGTKVEMVDLKEKTDGGSQCPDCEGKGFKEYDAGLVQILSVFPDFAVSPDVQQIAMLTLGVNDPAEALDQITKEAKGNPNVALTKALRGFREILVKGNGAR